MYEGTDDVVLQWWFYEICKNASGLICIKVDNSNSTIPRMLKWKAEKSVDKDFLVRKFSFFRPDQFSNVVPTEEEIESLHLQNLFVEKNEFVRREPIGRNDRFVPSTSSIYDEQLRNLTSSRCNYWMILLFHSFSVKVFEEFKVVHSTLKELHDMMDSNVNVENIHGKDVHHDRFTMLPSDKFINKSDVHIGDHDVSQHNQVGKFDSNGDEVSTFQSPEVVVQDSDTEEPFCQNLNGIQPADCEVKDSYVKDAHLANKGVDYVENSEISGDEVLNVDQASFKLSVLYSVDLIQNLEVELHDLAATDVDFDHKIISQSNLEDDQLQLGIECHLNKSGDPKCCSPIFNYLRNLAFHSSPVVVESVTTSDLIFHQMMRNTMELFTGDGAYVGKQLTDPLDVVFVDSLPAQEDGGLKIPTEWDVEYIHNRYAYFLYEHGCKKLANGYESEDDSPEVMPPESRKSNAVNVINTFISQM
ncbi:major capsid protein, partial [Striga asiatica]